MTLQQLLIGQFGVSGADLRESFPVVSQSPVQILPNDPNRVGFIVSNLSTNTIFVGLGNAVTSTTGLSLGGGNALSSKWRDDMQTVGFARFGISTTGTNQLYVAEFVMYTNEEHSVTGSSAAA